MGTYFYRPRTVFETVLGDLVGVQYETETGTGTGPVRVHVYLLRRKGKISTVGTVATGTVYMVWKQQLIKNIID